jgi:hypothetical protein
VAGLNFRPSEEQLRRQPIKFTVAGKDPDDPEQGRELAWRPQKIYTMIDGSGMLDGVDANDPAAGAKALKAQGDWLGNGLTDEDNEWLAARLKDADDWLDLGTLNEITRELMALVTGKRPTGSG